MKKRIFKKRIRKLNSSELVSAYLSSESIKEILIIEKEIRKRGFLSMVYGGYHFE